MGQQVRSPSLSPSLSPSFSVYLWLCLSVGPILFRNIWLYIPQKGPVWVHLLPSGFSWGAPGFGLGIEATRSYVFPMVERSGRRRGEESRNAAQGAIGTKEATRECRNCGKGCFVISQGVRQKQGVLPLHGSPFTTKKIVEKLACPFFLHYPKLYHKGYASANTEWLQRHIKINNTYRLPWCD